MSADEQPPVRKLERGPDPRVVSLLESMLQDARDGKILGIAAVTFIKGGSRQWEAGYYGNADALWAFEHMKHRLLFGT